MTTSSSKQKFLFDIRDILAFPSSPGSFVQVWERIEDYAGMFYEVADLKGMNMRRLNATEVHQYYRKPTPAEWKLIDDILSPPEPEDPDFSSSRPH